MEGRISTRSSASRGQASSPPNKTARQSQSPIPRSSRAIRSTRNGSQDISDGEVRARRSTRSRAGRESSIESTESLNSVDNSRFRKAKGKRKATRATATTAADLSMVAEDQEMEEADVDIEMVEDDDASQRKILPESPGALSNMSGTTALTSHSQQEMADLDSGIMVETLPDLLRASVQLLQLLAPPSLSLESIARTAKELQVPGSGIGKRLNLKEKAYDGYKTAYGSELFINPSYVSRKLFDDRAPSATVPKIDDILQEANVAMLIKTFIVAQRDSPDTMPLLQRLDDTFPSPFLTNYGDQLQNGSSALIDETFDLALDIRTQTIISALKANSSGYDPGYLLAEVFFDPPHQRTSSLSSLDDFSQNGQCRTVAGISVDMFSDEQVDSYSAQIRQRVEDIRSAFVVEPEAIHEGDLVDFDLLHQEYSWTKFLLKIAVWGQLRTEETRRNIENQGGIQIMMGNLGNIVQSLDSTAHFNLMQPNAFQIIQPPLSKRTLQLPAEIVPASAGKSFYQPVRSAHLAAKSLPSSSLPPSNQEQQGARFRMIQASSSRGPMTPHDKTSVPRERATAPAKVTDRMHTEQLSRPFDPEFRPIDEFDDEPQGNRDRSTKELVGAFIESENYKNKENRPLTEKSNVNPPKRRFIDRQENAQRIAWTDNEESQLEEAPTTPQKRSHQTFRENSTRDDEDDDDDDAYQQDDRIVDPFRRQQGSILLEPARKPISPTEPSRTKVRIQTSPKRREASRHYNLQEGLIHVEELPEEEDQDAALQASARNAAGGEDEEIEEEGPPATLREIKEQSKVMTVMSKANDSRQLRRRQPWSEEEESLLIRLIGKYGNQWSRIITEEGFNPKRDQVALKDKARNLKVDYLKTGSVLPLKFDWVALGQKERNKVKAYGRNPWRRESEEPGYETLDMDGNEFQDELE